MKEYIKPKFEFLMLNTIDVISASGENGEDTELVTLKTMVAGKEAVDYGAQNISVFDK